ncbi:MAG: outer membrane lipoprotein carrier protein LolA [Saprospiraceae bacterium]|nr:outer membrane lipoprotein carrier protein LolA [Saprospiraceae bacterium]
MFRLFSLSLCVVGLVVGMAFPMVAQNNKPTQTNNIAKNDPNATAALAAIQKKYNALSSLDVAFNLTNEIPSKPATTQKGTFVQMKDNYVLKLDEYELYCNGKNLWVYDKNKKLVQINDSGGQKKEASPDLLSPRDLLRIYEWKDFSHVISNISKDKQGNTTNEIDLIPLKKNSEYFKIKLTASQKNSQIQRIKVFYKDGVRQTFDVVTMTPNKKYASSYFEFDTKKNPKVKVEDLRID